MLERRTVLRLVRRLLPGLDVLRPPGHPCGYHRARRFRRYWTFQRPAVPALRLHIDRAHFRASRMAALVRVMP